MSASFTSTGRHIISVGEDSHIYVWNYDDMCIQSKQTKAIRSCEHFFCEGVSIAIPWSGRGMDQKGTFGFCSPQCCSPRQDHQDIHSCIGDSERFSLANWLFMDGSFRGSATWPEENLPLWGVPAEDREHQPCNNDDHHNRKHHNHNHNQNNNRRVLSATWGLVIVTAGSDGMIRTFHNYGLPFRK